MAPTGSMASSPSSEKPYYITTPIFYVNAAPHVGHLYTMIVTDILKRWQVLKGKRAILCTGTDEHGMKIQQAAEKANTPPKEFCDIGAETFKKLAARANLSNDHFIRTTDQDHKEAAQYFWRLLNERGYIYERKHEGYYCVSDETFYPVTALEKRQDPFTGKIFLASKETGKEVEWTSEINYHFRLSAFKDRLLEFYKKNPQFVVPQTRMNDVVRWVTEDLEDLSISRPSSRLKWGIPVPDDDSQTMYVWLDALVNYITKAGYPWAPGKENAGGWPADVQVIGKDIVRFHCIYWPAFLLALDIPPPKQILTHAHWTISKKKMSKSDGTGVDPFFALDRFGVDTMRFYFAHDGGIVDDADYSNELIVERYKKNLSGGLGNLVNRLTKGKGWSVRAAVVLAHAGGLRGDGLREIMEAVDGLKLTATTEKETLAIRKIVDAVQALRPTAEVAEDSSNIRNILKAIQDLRPAVDTKPTEGNALRASSTLGLPSVEPAEETMALRKLVEGVREDADRSFVLLNSGFALKRIMNVIVECNKYWSIMEPWKLATSGDPSDVARIQEVVYHSAEAVRVAGILLQPYMPEKSSMLLDKLGVAASRRRFEDAQFGADRDYGDSSAPVTNGRVDARWDTLFPPLAVED